MSAVTAVVRSDPASFEAAADEMRPRLDQLLPGVFAGFNQRSGLPAAALTAAEAVLRGHWESLLDHRAPDAAALAAAWSAAGLTPHHLVEIAGLALAALTDTAGRGHAWHGGGAAHVAAGIVALIMADLARTVTALETLSVQAALDEHRRAEAVVNLTQIGKVAIDVNEAMITLADLAHASKEVTNRSQQIAAATEELVASVEEIARNSQAASTDAQTAEGSVGRGIEAANEAIGTMKRIAQAVDSTAAKVNDLAEATKRVGEILVSIEAIAKQTNLLALNATIEAARAGDAGKGFAVVANEVKSLANQTARATDDIRTRIEGLRAEMAVILKAMGESAEAVASGQEVIAATGAEMEQVGAQVRGVTHKMHEIAGILQQQSIASTQVAEGISDIAAKAAHNDEALDKVATGIDHSNTAIAERVEAWAAVKSDRVLLETTKVDHVAYKKRVTDAVMGRATLDAGKMPDHITCRLGRWVAQVRDTRLRALPAFRRLEEPHRQVHERGKAALDALAKRDEERALDELRRLDAASHEVLDLLDELAKAVDD